MNNRRDFIKNTMMAGIGVTVLGKDSVIDNEYKKLKKSPQEKYDKESRGNQKNHSWRGRNCRALLCL